MFKRELVKPDGRLMQLYSRKPIDETIKATNPPHDPLSVNPQLRWHPLRGEWVAYASHRQTRTFLPPKEYSPLAVSANPEYPSEMPKGDYDVAVFENLFPSFYEESIQGPELSVPSRPAKGVCEVIVFTQDPDASLASLSIEEIRTVLEVIGERTREVGSRPGIEYVLPFENRGVEVGVTLHHPHGQLYAYPFLPPIPARMKQMEDEYFKKNNRTLVGDLVQDEMKSGQRMILDENETSAEIKAFIPICARYPYETWIAPVRSVPYIYELTDSELNQFAKTLKTVLMKFDAMWSRPFPYLMAIYQAPTKGTHPQAHMHFEIFPPYRTRDRLKYLAGTELGAGLFVNDSWPEEKALDLRNVKVEVAT